MEEMRMEKELKIIFRIVFNVLLIVFIFCSAVYSVALYELNKWIGYACVALFGALIYWRDYVKLDELESKLNGN
jgi:hypothetical protein